ncbi:hypothetical protein BVX98_01100 [bacterium F11]|nr:hypothetical protein BVX98_01100 [bacterium F11]
MATILSEAILLWRENLYDWYNVRILLCRRRKSNILFLQTVPTNGLTATVEKMTKEEGKMVGKLKYLINADEMTPEERLERITQLMAQGVLRLIWEGGTTKNAEAEQPCKWKVVQVEEHSNCLDFKIQMDAPRENLTPIQPKPPRIQKYLKQAQELSRRLEEDPHLTKSALAKEIGISRFELRHNLRLLHLAPEIQKFIMDLPPSKKDYPITKRKLRKISMIFNHHEQKDRFCELLSQTMGGNWIYEIGKGFKLLEKNTIKNEVQAKCQETQIIFADTQK